MAFKLPDLRREPQYIAIYESMKEDIVRGRAAERERLPSIRKLAASLSVSVTPVETAYAQLVAEGFVENRPRQGYYVLPLPETYGRLRLETTEPAADGPGPIQAAPSSLGAEPSFAFDFHLSKNDFASFPYDAWKKLYNRVLREEGRELLFYGDPQGEYGLRREIARYLASFRGVVCGPERIVVGAEQFVLMSLLAMMLRERVTALATEEPGYRLVPATFASFGVRIAPIELDEHGLDVTRLYESGAQAVCVSPSHQFPLGIVMPVARRLQLLEWARETGGYIVEDDYGGEFRYAGQPIPALQGLVPNDRVIYLGGFSQAFAPDVCLHYMVLPSELVDRFRALRRHLLFEPSASRIQQRVMERFIRNGSFEKHIRKMRTVYRRKNEALVAALRSRFRGAATVIGFQAGLHVILKLRAVASEDELLQAAAAAGVLVASAAFYWEPRETSDERAFIIGFGAVPLEKIDAGVARLREAWTPYLGGL
ncbi:PLP-dependent aminotransferase family protein [Paenibacillus antri]|uniref:PLP-dependent aminotransferase family protein n=1 Tax=Paenibacillus antri TaxID=2582848 RepID=A0A5R9GBW4_9BACL|nr:PLP-dependent aminotransferase family protein [Paenibacillus antri]TLS53957.1 PLP-dependent aminotransferase family protein [Paenibacillus antri]